LGTDAFNTSFSFGIDDGFFAVDDGAAIFNYGDSRPPTDLEAASSLASPTVIGNPFSGANVFLDLDNSTPRIPNTGIDNRTIINDRVTPDFSLTETQGLDRRFLQGVAGVSENPFQTGITEITEGEPNVLERIFQPGTPATVQIVDGVPIVIPAGPPTIQQTFTEGTRGSITTELPSLFQFPKKFLAQLQAQITSGNAKILTDPTIVVQEGQTATVNLTQEVVGNISSETESADGLTTRTVTAEIREAGLILELVVDRIDDNGFVTLAINPEVTSIGSVQDLSIGDDTNQIALLNTRELTSGQIRLRDGQTLILSGIIQESDRTTVRKVPILGDLPIIGALFRSTERQNQRQEVIVLVTPQILDDSERGSFGYNYTPGREAQEVLQRRGFPTQGGF